MLYLTKLIELIFSELQKRKVYGELYKNNTFVKIIFYHGLIFSIFKISNCTFPLRLILIFSPSLLFAIQ